jgi:hypothetical protein
MRIAESAAAILDPEERTTILKKVRRQSLMAAKGKRRQSASAPAHAPPGAHLAQHRAQLGSHAAAAAAVAAHAAAQGGGAAANAANAAKTATTGADADGEAVSRLLDRAEYTGSLLQNLRPLVDDSVSCRRVDELSSTHVDRVRCAMMRLAVKRRLKHEGSAEEEEEEPVDQALVDKKLDMDALWTLRHNLERLENIVELQLASRRPPTAAENAIAAALRAAAAASEADAAAAALESLRLAGEALASKQELARFKAAQKNMGNRILSLKAAAMLVAREEDKIRLYTNVVVRPILDRRANKMNATHSAIHDGNSSSGYDSAGSGGDRGDERIGEIRDDRVGGGSVGGYGSSDSGGGRSDEDSGGSGIDATDDDDNSDGSNDVDGDDDAYSTRVESAGTLWQQDQLEGFEKKQRKKKREARKKKAKEAKENEPEPVENASYEERLKNIDTFLADKNNKDDTSQAVRTQVMRSSGVGDALASSITTERRKKMLGFAEELRELEEGCTEGTFHMESSAAHAQSKTKEMEEQGRRIQGVVVPALASATARHGGVMGLQDHTERLQHHIGWVSDVIRDIDEYVHMNGLYWFIRRSMMV